ncbi:CSKI2 protein, partial [Atractosteus spatula]|nr:CSKI2 protein [Atractosteus spatula]
MGKEQDLLQAVKNGDLPSAQKLLAKIKAGRTILRDQRVQNFWMEHRLVYFKFALQLELLGSTKRLNVNYQDSDGGSRTSEWEEAQGDLCSPNSEPFHGAGDLPRLGWRGEGEQTEGGLYSQPHTSILACCGSSSHDSTCGPFSL